MSDLRLGARRQILAQIQSGLVSDSVFLFGALILTNAVAYVYQMILARIMSPEDYGTFVTLTSLSYVLAALMRAFQARMIKAVAETERATGRHMRPLLVAALRTFVPLGAVVLIAHWLVRRWVADFLHMDTTIPVIVLGLYTFSTFFPLIPRSMLLGLGRFRVAGLVQILEPVARMVVGMALVTWGLRVSGALAGFAAGNLAAFSIALLPLWPLLRRESDAAPSMGGLAVVDRYTLLALIVNASLMLMASAGQIAIKHFFAPEVAGNFAVAFLLGQVIAMSANCLGWVLFARSATRLQTTDAPLRPLQRASLLVKGLLAIGAIAVSLTVGFLVAPRLAIGLMGGSQYSTAHAYVGLVGIEMTLFALVYVQAYYLIALGRTQIAWPLGLALMLEVALLARYHATVQQILISLILVMGALLVYVCGFSWWTLSRSSECGVGT